MHIQSVEERLGFDLCALQIRREVRNAIEQGARIVLFANAEELYRKRHFVDSQISVPLVTAPLKGQGST